MGKDKPENMDENHEINKISELDGAEKKSALWNPYQVKYKDYLDCFDRIGIEKKTLEKSVYMHWHEFCELELVYDGEGIQRKRNVPRPFGKGVDRKSVV